MWGKKGRLLEILIEEMNESMWVAAVEKKRLVGLEVDPIGEYIRWGSLYYAKVTRIDAKMDAAFLELDQGLSGIIYARDVRVPAKGGSMKKHSGLKIGKLLQPGQFILVQAKNDNIPNVLDDDARVEDKSARMSMDISIPGRHLIYIPYSDENRVSQRISETALRKSLLKMVDDIADIKGCILRASAANTQTDILRNEGMLLKKLWDHVRGLGVGNKPKLLLLGPDAAVRTLSDQAGAHISRIEVVTMDSFQDIEEWCTAFAPDLVTKIHPVETDGDPESLELFETRGLVEQIEALLQDYLILDDGSNLIIQQTAALTVIDVNSGVSRKSTMEVNKSAIDTAASQIRLRNLGGVIVIDLINVKDAADRKKLLTHAKKAFSGDSCTVDIHGFTKTGLLEMTRHRRIAPLTERLSMLE